MNIVLAKWKDKLPDCECVPKMRRVALRLILDLLSLTVRGIEGIDSLMQRENYYYAQVLLASMIESCILSTYLLIDENHFRNYWYFLMVGDLKNEEGLERGNVRKEILEQLKSDKERLYLFSKKGINFEGDEDYLNIENYKYKSGFCGIIKIRTMYNKIKEKLKETRGGEIRNIYNNLYDLYREACKYKHFDPQEVTFSPACCDDINSALLFDSRLVKKTILKIHHFLLTAEACLMNNSLHFADLFGNVDIKNSLEESVKKTLDLDRTIIKFMDYYQRSVC